jgi:carbonic anhydrase
MNETTMKISRIRVAEFLGSAFLVAGICFVPSSPAIAMWRPIGPQHPETRTDAQHDSASVWNYEDKGPATWGTVSPEFAACGEGKRQSPIDIANVKSASSVGIKTDYKPASLRVVHTSHMSDVVNTGHTIQVNFVNGDTLTIGQDVYILQQFHFHDPSEHTVNGKHFPMEIHFVHTSAAKKLAVVSVLVEQGKANKAFEPIWLHLPKQKGLEAHLENVAIDVNKLLPRRKAAYRYEGSLTTPPCTEGVTWIVMKQRVQLSAEQIEAFRSILDGNNRPVQQLNERVVSSDSIR